MSRRLGPKKLEGIIGQAIDQIEDPAQRRLTHNHLVVSEITQFPEFTMAGIRVVPSGLPHIDEFTKFVEVQCQAFDAETGEEIEHPDGRFQFDQLPLRVHDGTWRREGDLIRPNLNEDVREALRIELVKSILATSGRDVPVFVPHPEPRYVVDDLGYRITDQGNVVPPPQVNGEWQPYGDPPPGQLWKENE